MSGTLPTSHEAEVFCSLSRDLHCILDDRGSLSHWSGCWDSAMGYSDDGLRGVALPDLIDAEDADAIRQALSALAAGGTAPDVTARFVRGDGSRVWLEWRFSRDTDGRVFAVGHDVSERRRYADAAADLRLLQDEAAASARLGSWRLDLADHTMSWSREMYRILGVDPATTFDLNRTMRDVTHPDDREMLARVNSAVLEDGHPRTVQYRIVHPDGSVRWVYGDGHPVADGSGRVVAFVGFIQDVTERVRSEEALRESEERYRSIIDGMQDAYFRAGTDSVLTLANVAAARMFGYDSPADMVGVDAATFYADTAERDDVIAQLMRDGVVTDHVGMARRRDGSTFWVSLNVDLLRDKSGAVVGTEGFTRDVTDRVMARQAQDESLSLLKATLESTADGILVVDPAGTVASFNQRFTELWGIPKRLLARRDDAELLEYVSAQLLDPASFREGVANLYEHPDAESFDVLTFTDGRVFERFSRPQLIDDRIAGRVWSFRDVTKRSQAEQGLRESEEDLRDAQAIARIGSYVYDLVMDRWTSSETMDDIFGIRKAYRRDLAGWTALVHKEDRDMMSRYFAEEVAGKRLPFDKQYRVTRHSDGETVWVHGHGRLETDIDGNPTRLIGTIQDVTRRHHGEEELRHTNASLERMVYDVAEAMGRVIEIRDQYTKGHQERVARLSKAIAIEMGLPACDVSAVEMAAVVHDIGKLSVPAEILSRPTKLSEVEFSLIKEHPHNGYEILKDIPFPWPVADIVLQHHERMDGSGYPGRLGGDDILPLARLLTVADVVEAMATHRPYRPALGLAAAVAELRSAPAKYDGAVVEACLRLYERGEIDL